MNRVFRISCHVCILLAVSLFVGCSDDDPASVKPPVQPALGGSIGIYADADGTDPTLVDTGGMVTFYVVHKVTQGAMASAYRIEAPAGWTLIAADAQFPVSLGDINDGISIAYGECLTGTIHVMTLTYQSPGNSASGTKFKVLPHSGWPENVRVVDCNQNTLDDAVGEESPVVKEPNLGGSIGVYADANVMTLTYQSPGNTTPGTMFKVLPHTGWPDNVRVVNCNQVTLDDAIGEETPIVLP